MFHAFTRIDLGISRNVSLLLHLREKPCVLTERSTSGVAILQGGTIFLANHNAVNELPVPLSARKWNDFTRLVRGTL